jgi:hypothetical protein
MQVLSVLRSFLFLFFFEVCLMNVSSLKDGLNTLVWIDVMCLDWSQNLNALNDAWQLRRAVAGMDHVLMVHFVCPLPMRSCFTRVIRYQRLGSTRLFLPGRQPYG